MLGGAKGFIACPKRHMSGKRLGTQGLLDDPEAPPERPEWSAVETLLDNNFRSASKAYFCRCSMDFRWIFDRFRGPKAFRGMMARDSEQGIDVEKKYSPRAQFCIPVLVTLREIKMSCLFRGIIVRCLLVFF